MERNSNGTVITVDRVIRAPAKAIFDVLADATRHPEIDGSGTLVTAKPGGPKRLALDTTFGMSMKLGIAYSMANTVVEFDPDHRIAWQTRMAGPLGRFLGGRIWRYELEEADEGTVVRESWDITQDKQRFLLRHGPLGGKTAMHMTTTLRRLAEVTEP